MGSRRALTIPGRPARRVYSCGDVEVDCDARVIHVAGQRQILTFAEFEVLLRLVKDRGRVLTRAELAPHVRSAGSASPRSVDTYITRLRCKLRESRTCTIETVQRIGYRCDGPASSEQVLGFPSRRSHDTAERDAERSVTAGGS